MALYGRHDENETAISLPVLLLKHGMKMASCDPRAVYQSNIVRTWWHLLQHLLTMFDTGQSLYLFQRNCSQFNVL